MEKVAGIGGLFFKAKDPERLRAWYRDHLGLVLDAHGGATLPWRDAARPDVLGATAWSLFAHDTTYFAPSPAPFMQNFRVRNLDRMLAQLRAAGAAVDGRIVDEPWGRFGWVMDPEGNRVELWEPPSSERDGLACYVVDAFTREAFRGNPAAVCPVPRFPEDGLMQRIAAENALSETAFIAPREDGDHDLRWMTPVTEVDLCGHATLASAHVLFTVLDPERAEALRFHTRSGVLQVARAGDGYAMDFPRRAVEPAPQAMATAAHAMGRPPAEAFRSAGSLLLVYASTEEVRALAPSMDRVRALDDARTVMVTARGTGADADVDFVSRFFAPKMGVDEDPVTGSSHCSLTPFWAQRLGRSRLRARQASARSGELTCELRGERVVIEGAAVLVKSGVLHVATG